MRNLNTLNNGFLKPEKGSLYHRCSHVYQVCIAKLIGTTSFYKNIRLIIILSFILNPLSSTANARDRVIDPDQKLVTFILEDSGVYRVSYEDLLEQGVDLLGMNHRQFGLVKNDQLVPIRTVGQRGQNKRSKLFGPSAYIEFYADDADDRYTNKMAFTLVYKTEKVRIHKLKRKKYKVHRKQAASITAHGVSHYRQKISFEENNYYDFLSPSQTDPWHFGQIIARGNEPTAGTSLQFVLPEVVGNSAQLEIEMYGLINTRDGDDHLITAYLNGLQLADEQFDGQVKHSYILEEAPVYSGTNEFSFSLQTANGAPISSVALNTLSLTYSRQAIADDGFLEGQFDDDYLIIDGFEQDEIVNAYRRDTSGSLTYLRKLSRLNSLAMIKSDGVAADFIIVAERAVRKPTIVPLPEEPLVISENAEYLIITHSDFIGAELDELVRLREQQYSVKVVTVEDIYANYGNHLPGADAIHEYIRSSAEIFGTRFIVLVGADSYDYKQNQQYAVPVTSFVPTLYRQARGGFLHSHQVQSDAAFGDLNNDNVPEIPVGRFPVSSTTELGIMVSKLTKFESSSPFSFSTLIADAGFSSDANGWINALPETSRIKSQMQNQYWEKFRAYTDEDGAYKAHSDILETLNLGVVVVNYFGHGSMSTLGSGTPSLLNADDSNFLYNTESPFVMLQWGSWTGSFAQPEASNSLMYRLLVENETGAASLTGLSTISSRINANRLSNELGSRLYKRGATLGESMVAAKQALATNYDGDSNDVVLGTQIIGDPALVINWWPD